MARGTFAFATPLNTLSLSDCGNPAACLCGCCHPVFQLRDSFMPRGHCPICFRIRCTPLLQLMLLGATSRHTCDGLHRCRNCCSSHYSSAGATFVACHSVTSFLACTSVHCCTHQIIEVDSIKTYLFYTLASAIPIFNQSKLDCANLYPAPPPCQWVWFSQMLLSLCYLLLRDASHELV